MEEEPTPEEIEEFREMFEVRERRAKEISDKVKELETAIRDKKFPIKKINFHTEMKDVDFTVLTDFDLWQEKKYEIIMLPVDTVAKLYISNPGKKFPKNKLFGTHSDVKIINLVEFLQNDNKVIPPVIRPVGGKYPIMFDQGNHRFALARFLKLKEMPFIVETKDVQKIRDLVFGNE